MLIRCCSEFKKHERLFQIFAPRGAYPRIIKLPNSAVGSFLSLVDMYEEGIQCFQQWNPANAIGIQWLSCP